MLDLVQQEEIVSRATGMPFDEILFLLDEGSPADLRDLYAGACDRYMILAGKGRRSNDENMELDRLDSALRMMLEENGLLVFASRLLRVLHAAQRGAQAFRNARIDAASVAATQLSLGAAAALSASGFQRALIPVDGPGMAELARRAQEALAILREGPGSRVGAWFGLGIRQASARLTTRFVETLAAGGAGIEAWLAAAALLDPSRTSPRQRLERTELCFRVGGLIACARLADDAGTAFREAARLVWEGLGA